jgi:hypothetical protein
LEIWTIGKYTSRDFSSDSSSSIPSNCSASKSLGLAIRSAVLPSSISVTSCIIGPFGDGIIDMVGMSASTKSTEHSTNWKIQSVLNRNL